MITHPEPDILECDFKWDLGSIIMNKASGGSGIPAELFQIPKDDAFQVLLNMSANLENSAMTIGLENVIPIPKKGNTKECSNYCTIALISHTGNIMLKGIA